MLENILKKSGTTDIIMSVIFTLFGIMLIAFPNIVTSLFSTIVGGVLVVFGAIKLMQALKNGKENNIFLPVAILAIVSGIVIMFFTNIILEFFRIAVAIWIIYAGIMSLIKVFSWREFSSRFWIVTLILSIALLGLGVYILVSPAVLIQTIGIIIVIYGVIDICANVIFANKINK